jgi:Cft2 family RNA processing exonuclease
MKRPLALTVLGGAREIGANSYHLDLGGAGLLLDAGTHPKLAAAEALPDLDTVPGEVDAILLSHAHLDHVGAIPVVLQRFPAARLFMTAPTSLLAIRMLRNAVAVSRNRDGKPLFSHDHVEWMEQVASTLEPGRPTTLETVGRQRPQVTFLGAGHVLGAAGILVEHRDRRFFYTGDTCATGQYICGPAQYPDGPIDLLLMDSTHGADPEPDLSRDRRGFGRAAADLGRFIADVAGRGGSVLLPVFALGRTQEILGVLSDLARRGRIPPLPIYISGLAHAICRMYDATRRASERRKPSLRLEDLGYTVLDPNRARGPALLREPCILAVSSGMMMPDTTSNLLAQRMVPDVKHGIGFVGYLDPECPGARLVQAGEGGEVRLGATADEGQLLPVVCSVRQFGFTAHSRASQLLQMVRELKPRRTVLVHGDGEAVDRLEAHLTAEGFEAQAAEVGATITF